MKKVNWGIIGLGAIAKQFAKGFENLNNSNLLAIASKNKEKLNDFKKNLNISDDYCFNNYEILLKITMKIDVFSEKRIIKLTSLAIILKGKS